MTQAEIEAAIVALDTALNTGVLSSEVEGVRVTFRSAADMETRLAALKSELATLTGTGQPVRLVRYGMTAGLT